CRRADDEAVFGVARRLRVYLEEIVRGEAPYVARGHFLEHDHAVAGRGVFGELDDRRQGDGEVQVVARDVVDGRGRGVCARERRGEGDVRGVGRRADAGGGDLPVLGVAPVADADAVVVG